MKIFHFTILSVISIFFVSCFTSTDESEKSGLLKESPIRSTPSITGMIGFGTWSTKAEFKDIKVVKNGELLFTSDFSEGLGQWNIMRGDWEVEGGVLRQLNEDPDTRILIGDPKWSDYTITLKARKIKGEEGFVIMFGIPELDLNKRSSWNLGGWGNSYHGLESPEIQNERVQGEIIEGKWYDIRIELNGETVKAFLDGSLVHVRAKLPDVPSFDVRPGYRVDLVAKNIGEVRFIEFGSNGELYVSQPRRGAIITLREVNGQYEKVSDFVTNKPRAHGMHFFDGWLWYAKSGAIWKARDTDGDGMADEDVLVLSGLPEGGGHWWRPILVTEEGFYTSIGDSGNITDETDTDRQKIWFYNLDGTGKTLFASGIRNNEKLRVRPETSEIYGADHGSDNYGALLGEQRGMIPFTDEIPPDEFNLYRSGEFYGHPFVVGNRIPRLEFQGRSDIVELAANTTVPAWNFGAHWATNGWDFLQSDTLGMKGDAVIACHGSWNSTVKVGYRLERLLFDDYTSEIMGSQMLVSTITDNQDVLGRPCDVAERSDGTIFFSDDMMGRIYKMTKGEMPKTDLMIVSGNGLPDAVITNPFRPLELFQTRCAACHGSYGAGFGDQFKDKYSDDSLKIKLYQMMEGQAQVHLDGQQTSMMMNYLKSLRDDKPYGLIVEIDKEGWVYGEASQGSRISLKDGSSILQVGMEGHTWKTKIPKESDKNKTQIIITKNGQATTLDIRGFNE
jgi:glucose/arabinose dehydrogenase